MSSVVGVAGSIVKAVQKVQTLFQRACRDDLTRYTVPNDNSLVVEEAVVALGSEPGDRDKIERCALDADSLPTEDPPTCVNVNKAFGRSSNRAS
jgi:hypothetical protein